MQRSSCRRAWPNWRAAATAAAIYNALNLAILGGDQPPAIDETTQPAYTAVAVCASRTGHHLAALRVSAELYKLDPQTPLAYLVPESEIALGMYSEALKDIQTLLKRRPKDAHVGAGLRRRQLQAGAVAGVPHGGAASRRAVAGSHRRRREEAASRRSFTRCAPRRCFTPASSMSRPPSCEAARKLAGSAADPAWEKRLKRNEIVKLGKLAVEPLFDKSVPLGVYHLLGQVKGTRPVLTLKLYNFDDKPRNVRIEVEIPGVTEKKVTTKLLMPGKKEVAELTPPLRTDFPIGVAARRAAVAAQTSRCPSAPSRSTRRAIPSPCCRATRCRCRSASTPISSSPTPGFIAAWVTPNAKAVDAFLNQAKARVNGTFAGEQTATFPQVKAIWDELSAQGVSYVMDPAVLADFGFAQRTRLPAEVLQSKNAQCLEGTILFATLLEAIGLSPIIVRVPGHAFVGWRPNASDGAKARRPRLRGDDHGAQRQVRGRHPRRAASVVLEEKKAGHFAKGIYGPAFMLELADLRKQGFPPAARRVNIRRRGCCPAPQPFAQDFR